MKISIFSLITCITLCSCNSKPADKVVFTKDFIAENPQWKIATDTLHKEFTIGFEDIKDSMRVSWIAAKDQTGCLRIGYLKFENVSKESKLRIENIKTANVECGMKFDSPDTTRFETLVLSADYSTTKNIKEYKYRGSIINIMGNGESKVIND